MEMNLSHASGILAIRFSTSSDSSGSCCAPATHKKEPEGRIYISNEDLPSTLQFGIAISVQNGLSTILARSSSAKFTKRLAKKLGFRW